MILLVLMKWIRSKAILDQKMLYIDVYNILTEIQLSAEGLLKFLCTM